MDIQHRPFSSVYAPRSQLVGVEECRSLLDQVGVAMWITSDEGCAPSATLLPTLWRGDRLIAHASGHNAQFADREGEVPCRVVVQGADAYISPRWYPSIQAPEHAGTARGRALGRAVGTWDYEQVQIAGWLKVHRDRERLRGEVAELGELHDAERLADSCPSDAHRGPWTPSEAPHDFLEAMLGGIVGLELRVTDVVGRFKLSQNRTEADRSGAASGLVERGRPSDVAVADAIGRATPLYDPTGE